MVVAQHTERAGAYGRRFGRDAGIEHVRPEVHGDDQQDHTAERDERNVGDLLSGQRGSVSK